MFDIRTRARKLALGAVSAMVAVASLAATAAPADAAWRGRHHHHRGGGWIGPAIIGGIALGALGARSYYGSRCWVEPRRVVDRHGRWVVRRVEVCG